MEEIKDGFNFMSPKIIVPVLLLLIVLGYFALAGGSGPEPPPKAQEAKEQVGKRRPKTKGKAKGKK